MPESVGEILKVISRSGFPFQLAVEQEIRSNESSHHWSVESGEHPWPTDTDHGFIDIVLRHNEYSTFRLAIECKRVKSDDARQLQWVFLIPDKAKETAITSSFEVEFNIGPNKLLVWDDVRLRPPSYESAFCVLPGDEQGRQSTLEKLSVDVLESAKGLAQEEIRLALSQDRRHTRLFIFAAIVTNATISICEFDPRAVNLSDGAISEGNAKIIEVPFVRFRKSLTTKFPEGRGFDDLKAANKARERTVFVVNASRLAEFLTNWHVEPLEAYRGYAIQGLWGSG